MKKSFLEELGDKYGPTKKRHNYLPFFDRHLSEKRDEVKAILEIGVQTDRSIKMWEEYFPNATIVGLDIDENCKNFRGGRRKIVIGSQDDPKVLQSICKKYGPFDVIIDDGSHIPRHVLASFDFLCRHMTRNGVYIVEDTGGVVHDLDGVVVEPFKAHIDRIMHWPKDVPAMFWPYVSKIAEDPDDYLLTRIIGAAFYRWMIVVEFGDNPGNNPFLDDPSKLTEENARTALSRTLSNERVEELIGRMKSGYFADYW